MASARRKVLKKLLQPGQIGQMHLKNRIVMPAMGTNFAEDGYPTEQMRNYYEERAKGGVGLVVVEATCVDSPIGQASSRQLNLDTDKFIPAFSDLVRVVHKHGAKAAVQLHHAGRATTAEVCGLQPVGPSPIPMPPALWGRCEGEVPRELTREEVEHIIDCFAKAAERAKNAGFDGVEIHAAHGYLIAQFLSAHSNKRRDEYGGDLKNRARLLVRVIRAAKELTGEEFPIWCRINGREYGIQDGLRNEDAQELAKTIQDAGGDAVHVSAFSWGLSPRVPPPMSERQASMVHLAEPIKRVVSIPVIAVGRIDPEIGESILEDSRADFVAVGRGLIADPEFPNKAASGRLDEIAPCIGCMNCMNLMTFHGESLKCTVNPAVGREQEYRLRRAKKSKRVLVVGGGPAGVEAARVAALRGHQVALYEKDTELGGQMLLAIKPPYKTNLTYFIDYLSKQPVKVNVKVESGKDITPEMVKELNPDTVVLATGITTLIPEIPGIRRTRVVTAVDVLANKVKVGGKVVIIGGELIGCEAAEFLADKGKKVTITRRGPDMAIKMPFTLRSLLLGRLSAKGVAMLTGVTYEEITGAGLVITTKEGERRLIEADTIVLAAGAKPSLKLFQELEGKIPKLYRVGDCVEPRNLLQAIADGSRVGREI